MNPCKFNTYLTAYVLRDMDQKRLDALDAHLKTCPECQKKASELRHTLSLLKEAFPAEKAETGKAPVLDPERLQQLLTIKPLPKPNIFRKFIDKAFRPLRMIAATLICVFGLLVILSASLNQFIGIFSTAGKCATGESLGGRGGGGQEVFFSLAAKGAAVEALGDDASIKANRTIATTDALTLTSELQDSDARMDVSGAQKSKLREQAGQKLGEDLGWSGGDKDVNRRGKAKHADRNADGYVAGVIMNGRAAPAAEPEPAPTKIQPEAIDEVTAVKSPGVTRGVYSSRTLAGRASSGPSDRVSTAPVGATTPAPTETAATPPAPATPMPTAGRNSFAYDKEVAAPEKTESSTRSRLGGAKSGLAQAAGDASMSKELRTKSELRRDYDADGFAVISREELTPASTPPPLSPQPASFDSVAMVKSPITMKGVYASRSPGSRGNLSRSLENEKSAKVAADMPSPAGKPSDEVPVVLLEGDAAPSQPASSTRFGLGSVGGKAGAGHRAAGEESEKDALRQMEPLKIQAAKPSFTGTPKDIRSANLEKPGERDNKPADYPVVSYERVAESKVAPDSKFQKTGNGDLFNGETVVSSGTLTTGKRELKRSEAPQKEEESAKQVVALNGGLTLSGATTATTDFKLGINNELKKAMSDDDGDAFANSHGTKAAADQSRLWSDSYGLNQKDEKKLEEFAEAADLRKKPSPPREPLPFNSFVLAAAEPFSTFAMDVDTASYTLTRQALRSGKLPDPERVRLEEIVNAFDYADTAPDRATFRVYQDGAQSPFSAGYNLLRIGVKGRRLGREEQRPAMLTFVIDVSGSMSQPDRIGFARQALSSLLDQVGSGDRIQIIAYSDHAQFVLPPSPASEKARIMAAFDRLQCNGSTNLEEGLLRAYEQAGQAFIPGAENRVILISDGVANLGADSAQEILDKVAANRKQGITCSVFGVGSGTYNDKMLQELANKGDGVYRFLDSAEEVKTAFVDDLAATLNFIAKDAKIQVEWNPKTVKRYRQMGYEKRKLTKEQFRDDAVDAGEVGSGQSVTALYELELMPDVTPESSLGTVRIRYQRTDNGKVEEIEAALVAATVLRPAHQASVHFKVAASAAQFAELLRGSPNARNGRFDTVADYLRPAVLERSLDTRIKELLELVMTAASLTK